MSNYSNCPSTNMLEAYFNQELDKQTRREIEEHFYDCTVCLEKAREMSEVSSMRYVSKATVFLGEAWEKYGDSMVLKAAGESKIKEAREFVTANGKYRITLRPIEKRPESALLEIEVLDNSSPEKLRVNTTSNFDTILEIDENNMACTVVSNSIDLDRLIIVKL